MSREDHIIPPWVGRLTAFVGITAVATIAALVVWWLLFFFGVGGDDFFGASLVHPNLVVAAAASCGIVVGLAGASSAERDAGFHRAAAVALVLLVAGVAAILIWSAVPEPRFDASTFRSATAARDSELMKREAYRAVEQDALIGLSRVRIEQMLGKPPRIGRRTHQWIWDVGLINDFLGPGDAGALYVKFDSSWTRVTAAKVDQSGF